MDHDLLLDLSRLRDELGVLSVYVTAERSNPPSSTPAWVIRIRRELAALRDRVKAEGPRERWVALDHRLTELEPELSALLDPASSGLGRALFARMSGGQVQTLRLQLPLPDLVVLQPTAYLLPVLAALEVGAPAGVAVVSHDGARLLEWSQGGAELLEMFPFEAAVSDWREMKGPPASNPALAQKAPSQRDLFERRVDGLLAKFLHGVGRRVAERAGARGWDVVVVAGDARLAEITEGGMRDRGTTASCLRVPHVLSSAPPPQVAGAVTAELLDFRQGVWAGLAEQARSAALAGGAGAYGLADTLGALAEGRVTRLLLDRAGRWEGSRTPDGRLVPDREVPPGVRPEELAPEEHLAERMVEQALASGADVIVVDGSAAEVLAPAGVAAVLRW